MIAVPHPSCAAAARAHVAMLCASGSYRHHLTCVHHVSSLTRVKCTPSTSETSGGGEGGEGGDNGGRGGIDRVKQISQPALRTLPSVCHSIGVPSGTTPSGESLPQYLAPFTVRWSYKQAVLASTAKDVTKIGTAGGLVIVQSSLSE